MEQLELFQDKDLETFKPYTITNGKLIWDIPYKFIDGADRPKCLNIGCKNPVALSRGRIDNPVNRTLRSVCSFCHEAGYKGKPLKAGVISAKRNFCENTDGRLGFICNAQIMYSGQLELDHKNGDHNHNTISNVQTICKVCHSLKSLLNGDFKDQSHKKSNASKTSSLVPGSAPSTKSRPIQQTTIPCIEDYDQQEILGCSDILSTFLFG